MQPIEFIAQYVGIPVETFQASRMADLPFQISSDADGHHLSITHWDSSRLNGKIQPSDSDLNTALGLPTPIEALASRLVAAAAAAATAVSAQVVPDSTHLTAYLNVAAIVGPAATLPTVEPWKTAFASLATANGFGADLQGFATLAVSVGAMSASLSALVTSVSAAAHQATASVAAATADKAAAAYQAAVSSLEAALETFSSGLAALVAALNGAGLTVTIAAPAEISIAGINA
jgi:hypothetical protein